jgi:membrane associated rhomboid family serine protease
VIPLRDANPTRRRAVVTLGLVAMNLLVFGVELILEEGSTADLEAFFRTFGVVPAALLDAWRSGAWLSGETFSLLSHQFLHAGWLHIGFNLLYLWIFGNNVEDLLGRLPFLVFYLAGGVVAALVQVAAGLASGGPADAPLVGASGAISAVLGAYLVWYPRARVLSVVYVGLFFQLVQVPAVLVLGLFFLLQLLAGVAVLSSEPSVGGVAYFAHIGGFVMGLLVAGGLRVLRVVSVDSGHVDR